MVFPINGAFLVRRRFTLDDFRKQIAIIAKSEAIQGILDSIPTTSPLRDAVHDFDSTEMQGKIGIIDAMTPVERSNSNIIDRSRRIRIADGAGCAPQDVCDLVRQYSGDGQRCGRHGQQRKTRTEGDARRSPIRNSRFASPH